VAEPGSELVRDVMTEADGWFVCRVGFVEVVRAIGLAAGRSVVRAFEVEWPSFGVVEVDQDLVTDASRLAFERDLRSLDALHLAAARVLADVDLVFATWDKRLHDASVADGLTVAPERLGH
jgi:predicted nucleic acid-binding protein